MEKTNKTSVLSKAAMLFVLVLMLSFSAQSVAFAQDAPPTIDDPFGSGADGGTVEEPDAEAPPSLILAPPDETLPAPDEPVVDPPADDPVIPEPPAPPAPTTAAPAPTPVTEQLPDTGPGLGYLLVLMGGSVIAFRKKK